MRNRRFDPLPLTCIACCEVSTITFVDSIFLRRCGDVQSVQIRRVFMEFERLSLKIDRAERALSKRLRETEEPALGAEERTALYDALRALRVMSPQKSETARI